eukprot:COSAG01_NODE_25875_length_730_cov_1.551506_1_plen_100_part_10
MHAQERLTAAAAPPPPPPPPLAAGPPCSSGTTLTPSVHRAVALEARSPRGQRGTDTPAASSTTVGNSASDCTIDRALPPLLTPGARIISGTLVACSKSVT